MQLDSDIRDWGGFLPKLDFLQGKDYTFILILFYAGSFPVNVPLPLGLLMLGWLVCLFWIIAIINHNTLNKQSYPHQLGHNEIFVSHAPNPSKQLFFFITILQNQSSPPPHSFLPCPLMQRLLKELMLTKTLLKCWAKHYCMMQQAIHKAPWKICLTSSPDYPKLTPRPYWSTYPALLWLILKVFMGFRQLPPGY